MGNIKDSLNSILNVSPNTALVLVGFLISAAIAYWIYSKTLVDRSIAIVQFPITDLTTSLKKLAVDLSIKFGGKEVQNLGSIELRVENRGKFSFENLEIHVFANELCEFLNVSIVTNQEILAKGFRWHANLPDKYAVLNIPYMNSRTNALISVYFSGIPHNFKVEPKINSDHKIVVIDSDQWVDGKERMIRILGLTFVALSIGFIGSSLFSVFDRYTQDSNKSEIHTKSYYDRIPDIDSNLQINPDKQNFLK
jgi:hypothetical protein